MYKAISLILLLSIIIISGDLEGKALPPDYCPFSNGDRAEYIIWGEWQGLKAPFYHGNNTGLHTIDVINRTSSQITISEKKAEIMQEVNQTGTYVTPINVSSSWVYDTSTRRSVQFESYAWMWIKISSSEMNSSQIKILSRVFQIVTKRNYTYFQDTRSAWVAIYNKTSSDSLYTNSFEMWFDTHTGVMVYYIVRSSIYDTQGTKIEWTYYSTRLNLTTIDLSQSYIIPDYTGTMTTWNPLPSGDIFSVTGLETMVFMGILICFIGAWAYISSKRRKLEDDFRE
ncbi:MAG: hypothetical protein ACFFAE_09390 [Candidatus Hodarchaeota archaeon]